MARTKLTPRKGEKCSKRWVLRLRDTRKALAEKGWRPLLPFTTHPKSRSPHPEERRWRGGQKNQRSRWRRQDGWKMWAGHLHHCQPNSWPRWLQRLGHLHWVGRNQSGGSSNQLWEAKPLGNNSSRPVNLRSTGLAQLLFVRSSSSKRALSSLLGNSPSHG